MKPTVESLKFRDIFSAKYVLMILGAAVLAAFIIYIPSRPGNDDTFFYLLILAAISLVEFYMFSRKVVIHEKSVTISYRPFTNTANHNENGIRQSKVWAYRFSFYFTIDNIKSIKLLPSSEAMSLSEKKFGYLANGKEALLIEFIKPLDVRLWPLVINKYPATVSAIAVSTKDLDLLYTTLSQSLTQTSL